MPDNRLSRVQHFIIACGLAAGGTFALAALPITFGTRTDPVATFVVLGLLPLLGPLVGALYSPPLPETLLAVPLLAVLAFAVFGRPRPVVLLVYPALFLWVFLGYLCIGVAC